LTEHGESRVKTTGRALIGEDRLIAPSQIAHIYVSPRQRAQQTLRLLHSHLPESCRAATTTTDLLKEWHYGEYEGEFSSDIRKKAGGVWDIWTDGCPGGESPKDVEERCDRLIQEIREKWHKPAFEGKRPSGDVILVAHGHLLRVFATRWIGRSVSEGVPLVLEAGGVGTLR
jgi:broad specificity phosphatase PhoE